MKLQPAALLTALASLTLGGACKSDDAGGSKAPQQPTATVAGAPGSVDGEPDDGPALPPPPRRMSASDGTAGGAAGMPDDRRARREEMRRKYDTDGNGRLSKEEREAMRRAMLDRRMSRLDGDGDGKISREEAGRAPIGRRLLADFDAADSNRDSFVSREELDAAVKLLQQRRREARMRGDLEGGAPPPAEDGQGMPDDAP